MAMQTQTSSGRRDVSASASPNGVIANAAADPQVIAMAIAEAQNRASERHAMVALAAYYRAQKRGFEAGHELEDWLAAEEEVAAAKRLTILSPSDSIASIAK